MSETPRSKKVPAPTTPSTSRSLGNVLCPAMDGILSSSTTIATISVKGGVKFYVHKKVPTQNSAYFDRALNGAFLECNTQSVNLDDNNAEDFDRYVNILYQAVLTENVTLVDMSDNFPCSSILRKLLRLWQLSDRFLDSKMKAIAEKSIDSRFELLSVRAWGDLHEQDPTSKTNIPYQDHLVTALANCPPQVFAEHAEDLNGNLEKAVIKAFALRFADCNTSTKAAKAAKAAKNQTTNKSGSAKKRKWDLDSDSTT